MTATDLFAAGILTGATIAALWPHHHRHDDDLRTLRRNEQTRNQLRKGKQP